MWDPACGHCLVSPRMNSKVTDYAKGKISKRRLKLIQGAAEGLWYLHGRGP